MAACAAATLAMLLSARGSAQEKTEETVACPVPLEDLAVTPPPDPTCDNEFLTAFDGLLVLAPHPDDETLAFAGLLVEYMKQSKPVEVVVVTDGDAYCGACKFWKNGSTLGSTCNARDLSNLATPEVDSFAEIRRGESTAAAAILGRGAPRFFGYPDTGLAAAWANHKGGKASAWLRRSDFSHCTDCRTCEGGYGEGPETPLSAATLVESLSERLAATSERTLVATTHWLDGHGDHAALGRFVKTLNAALDTPRSIAYGVIHAHTPKDSPHPDCWYPGPAALACPCSLEHCATATPNWLSSLRSHRYRPTWPAVLPDDASYGEEKQLCLPEELYHGDGAKKRAAIEAYRSQLGFLSREGEIPEALGGMIDCNGYLISFVRRTEVFAFVPALR